MTGAETGWYLRHRDGVEHGPFQFTDIIEAAKLGNIASDTCVRHETQTLDQWVLAARVQAIASIMTNAQSRQGALRQTRAPSSARAQAPAQTQAPARAQAPVRAPSPAPAPSQVTASVGRTAQDRAMSAGGESSPAAPSLPVQAEATPLIRTHRQHGYPVPKTWSGACAAFFDVRFRSFVTPWIISLLWALTLGGFVLWLGKLGYEAFVQQELSAARDTAPDPSRGQWQFEPLADQAFLQTKFFRFCWQAGGLCLGLLVARVLCETAVLLLRAASDLDELKSHDKD